jgi:hypothetical protein
MRTMPYALLTLGLLLLWPATAEAADPLFASYWIRFKEHWLGFFVKQNGIISLVLLVGAVSIFIVTRGKWKK